MFQRPIPGIVASAQIGGRAGHANAWDVDNIAATPEASASILSSNDPGFEFSPDGKYVFYFKNVSNTIVDVGRRTLSTAWDLSTVGAEDHAGCRVTDGAGIDGVGLTISWDGATVFAMHFQVFEDWYSSKFALSTPFDLTTAGAAQSFGPFTSASWQFSGDPEAGKNFITLDDAYNGNITSRTDLPTPYIMTGGGSTTQTLPGGFWTSPTYKWDGTKMYLQGAAATNAIRQYTLPTPFDLAAWSFDKSRALQSGSMGRFSWDGTKWYDQSGTTLRQYDVPPP